MLLSLLAASLTRARFAGRVTRLCVRTLAFSRGSSSGRPLPSAHLVSFGGIISSMGRSDSRPQLGGALRFSLAPRPRRSVAVSLSDGAHAAFDRQNGSASTTFQLSRLTTRIPHNPCLRFRPRVTATPARLGSDPASYGSGRSGLSPVCLRQLHPSALGQLVEKQIA